MNSRHITLVDKVEQQLVSFEQDGKTAMLIDINEQLAGTVAVADIGMTVETGKRWKLRIYYINSWRFKQYS